MTAHSWAERAPDFLLSKSPAGRRLLTPLSGQATWFLPALDPDRALPRLGPALYLELADACAMVSLLQDQGFTLRAWSPPITTSTDNLLVFPPAPPPEPEAPRSPLAWPYDFNRMSERQLLVLRSLLDLPPGGGSYSIALD
jgi:hypothetical protein